MVKAMRNFFGSAILLSIFDFKMIELTAANAGFTEPGLGVALDTGRKIGPRGVAGDGFRMFYGGCNWDYPL